MAHPRLFPFLPMASLISMIAWASPRALKENNYDPTLGVVLFSADWGRTWKCGNYEAVRLESMAFTRDPVGSAPPELLEVKAPFELFSRKKRVEYAFVVGPGEYFLTAFNVKLISSASDIKHIAASLGKFSREERPNWGSFTVHAGEAIYIGHFGLDCAAEPYFWRFYLDAQKDFEDYVSEFRDRNPFMRKVPVVYRLFATERFGFNHSIPKPCIE